MYSDAQLMNNYILNVCSWVFFIILFLFLLFSVVFLSCCLSIVKFIFVLFIWFQQWVASLDEFCFSGNQPHNLYCFVYNFQSFFWVNKIWWWWWDISVESGLEYSELLTGDNVSVLCNTVGLQSADAPSSAIQPNFLDSPLMWTVHVPMTVAGQSWFTGLYKRCCKTDMRSSSLQALSYVLTVTTRHPRRQRWG